jgi:hypothetical protein
MAGKAEDQKLHRTGVQLLKRTRESDVARERPVARGKRTRRVQDHETILRTETRAPKERRSCGLVSRAKIGVDADGTETGLFDG